MSGFEEWMATVAPYDAWWNRHGSGYPPHVRELVSRAWHARDAEIAALKAEMSAMKKSNCALCNRIVIWQEAWDEQFPALRERIAELELEAEVAAMDISLAEMDYEADHDT